jgi:hypothetical protein
MKLPSAYHCVGVITLVLALVLGRSALAIPPDENVASEPAVVDLKSLSNSEALKLAYFVLGPGNRNYQNHRASAMKEIKAAADLTNVEVTADEFKGKEDQKMSNARLQLSLRLLTEIRDRWVEAGPNPALEHLEKAMKHLSRGLKIREAIDRINEEEGPL